MLFSFVLVACLSVLLFFQITWMTVWFNQNLLSVFHDEPILIQFKDYPQEINPKLDGGLYMNEGSRPFLVIWTIRVCLELG